jgi:hypothetical protein
MGIGLITWKADGTPVVTAQGGGGVFVEMLSASPGQGSFTKYYSNAIGMVLRVYQVQAGAFTWSTGVDGWGVPYITLSQLEVKNVSGPATLMVFAE